MIQKANKTDLSIEIMSYCHVQEVRDIESQCFSDSWSERSIIESLKNPNSHFIIALNYNKVVGYAGMYKIIDEGYMYNIAVKKQFRSMGIGKMLIKSLCRYSIKNELKFISLEVRISNKQAILLYEKLGFIALGRRENFYRNPKEDALIMTKFFDGIYG